MGCLGRPPIGMYFREDGAETERVVSAAVSEPAAVGSAAGTMTHSSDKRKVRRVVRGLGGNAGLLKK